MKDRRIQCKVVDQAAPPVDADGFRLLEEVGDSVFLDFLRVHPTHGEVVARFRMQRSTLAAVRERLVHDVIEHLSGMVH